MMRGVVNRLLLLLVFGACLAATWQSRAQARYRSLIYQEPRWFTFHLAEVSTGVYAQGDYQESTFRGSDTSVKYDREFVGPTIGLNANGSIYHPNLIQYAVLSDGAFGYARDTFQSGGVTTTRQEWDYLGSFAGTLEFLPGKPYRAGAYVNYDHTYRDNDFFSRVTVDSWRYGGRVSWTSGPWVLSGAYAHRDENSSSPYPVTQITQVTETINGTNVTHSVTNRSTLDQFIESHDDTATINLRHQRERGATSLGYNLEQYTRSDLGRLGEGTDHNVTLGDSERWGDREQHHFNASAGYTHRDTTFEKSDELTANTDLSLEHTRTLSSYYAFAFDRFETGNFDTDNYSGSASVTHQLYESLTSSLTARASDTENSDPIFTGYVRRYGAGISEAYTKRLSDTARLRLSNSLFVDHSDQSNSGRVDNEHHSILDVPGGENGAGRQSFFLDLPQVLQNTILITDQSRLVQYLPGFDYEVLPPLGTRTIVHWLRPPGPGTPTTVVVHYETAPTAPGSYETLSDSFMARLDLWQNLWGIYGRVSLSRNNAPAELRIEDFLTYAVGTDVTWRWLRAGVEYAVYDSTTSEFSSVQAFESAVFRPDAASLFSLDLIQSWYNYKTVHRQEQDYRFISRYRRTLTGHLGITAEGGFDVRRGEGANQLLATVRPAISYVEGRLSVEAGYEYNYENFLDNEERQKHRLFLRLRRTF